MIDAEASCQRLVSTTQHHVEAGITGLGEHLEGQRCWFPLDTHECLELVAVPEAEHLEAAGAECSTTGSPPRRGNGRPEVFKGARHQPPRRRSTKGSLWSNNACARAVFSRPSELARNETTSAISQTSDVATSASTTSVSTRSSRRRRRGPSSSCRALTSRDRSARRTPRARSSPPWGFQRGRASQAPARVAASYRTPRRRHRANRRLRDPSTARSALSATRSGRGGNSSGAWPTLWRPSTSCGSRRSHVWFLACCSRTASDRLATSTPEPQRPLAECLGEGVQPRRGRRRLPGARAVVRCDGGPAAGCRPPR